MSPSLPAPTELGEGAADVEHRLPGFAAFVQLCFTGLPHYRMVLTELKRGSMAITDAGELEGRTIVAMRRSGDTVICVPFRDGTPSGPPLDVLTGFVDADGNARGRPVGVAVDKRGALLVADDVGNVIWRVSMSE